MKLKNSPTQRTIGQQIKINLDTLIAENNSW